VPTYEWSNQTIISQATSGTNPQWYTATTPVQMITTQSPLGADSRLVRSELFFSLAWHRFTGVTGTHGNLPISMAALARGEVYSTGSGGFPDPRSNAPGKGVITADAAAFTNSYESDTFLVDSGRIATDGFVTSQGERGPADYGGGTPELRIGLFVAHVTSTPLLLAAYDTYWTYHLRALWRS